MAAKRALGQHFLVDRRSVSRIGRALGPRPGEALLEIGPGRGALTADLVRRAGRIAAVEVDTVLADRLCARFAADALVLLRGDVRSISLKRVLRALGRSEDERLAIAGNLPYNISKPIVQKLIRERAQVGRAVLMFQREVADRLTALPGTRGYGPLGILAGLAFEIEVLFELPPRSFWPPPKVLSAVTRWRPRPDAPLDREREGRLRSVLGACFYRRRRTLRNNLRSALGDLSRVESLLQATDIDGDLRAEALSPREFVKLARRWEPPPLV